MLNYGQIAHVNVIAAAVTVATATTIAVTCTFRTTQYNSCYPGEVRLWCIVQFILVINVEYVDLHDPFSQGRPVPTKKPRATLLLGNIIHRNIHIHMAGLINKECAIYDRSTLTGAHIAANTGTDVMKGSSIGTESIPLNRFNMPSSIWRTLPAVL